MSFIVACFSALLLAPTCTHAQIRHGASFLRLMPGPRQQGLASSSTGVLDEHYTVYANPGAAGFMREWQWSASYSRWIADVYSASVFYGQRVRMPWSRHTRFGFGVAYQGVPEFDSSQRTVAQASASDALFAVSVGQPFQIARQHFAFGMNAKYLLSKLAHYDANTWIVDLGVMYRTKKFSLLKTGGLFEHGIISAGVAFTQLGPALEFIANKTPLPRTLRAGLAFNAGRHEGLQMQFALDYHRTQKEPGEMSLGTELSWGQIVSLRGGYDFENRLISPIAFGVSFRFDDHKMPLHSALPGRNKALRFDLAAAEDNLLFSRPYRGGMTHHAIGPESFGWGGPTHGALIEGDSVRLAWEATRDPDLYDDAQYLLLVDQDSLALAQAVLLAERNSAAFFNQPTSKAFRVNQKLTSTSYLLTPLEPGKHYWSVLAYDVDQHVRVIGKQERRLNMFRVLAPALEIKAITFEPHPWITEDQYQGQIKITVASAGVRNVAEVALTLYDSIATRSSYASTTSRGHGENRARNLIGRVALTNLQPGAEHTVAFEWQTPHHGLHHVTALVDEERRVLKTRARRDEKFYTIPKGRFTTSDTVTAFELARVAYEVPFIPEVCFEAGSAEIVADYVRRWYLEPPLKTLARRMQAHPNMRVHLQGFADPNSNEHEAALANTRAAAVRDSLVRLGAATEQIKILPGQVLPLRRTPAKPDDARWVTHERRYVQITTDLANEPVLFELVAFEDVDTLPQPVVFTAAIEGAVPLREAALQLGGATKEQVALATLMHGARLHGAYVWKEHGTDARAWQAQNAGYEIALTDSLQRTFRTQPRSTYLYAKPKLKAQHVSWPIRFNVTAPMYDFYWSKLLKHINFMLTQPNMRMRFSGHACAIGPEAINLRLSQRRAEDFQHGFLRYAQGQYPGAFQEIAARTGEPKGHGILQPMKLNLRSGATDIRGLNETPLARKLNRRIEVEFYYP